MKNATKDRCESLKPRMLKGILKGGNKTQTLKGKKVKETHQKELKTNGSNSKNQWLKMLKALDSSLNKSLPKNVEVYSKP